MITYGEVFGRNIIEVVTTDDALKNPKLLVWDGAQSRIGPSLKRTFRPNHDRTYYPPELHPSIWRAMRFPSSIANYISTRKLFEEICSVITKFTLLGDNLTRIATNCVLASWFADCTITPVCLAITGLRSTQGSQLFRLLSGFYYHSLLLGDCSLLNLSGIPMEFHPSLFIEYYQSSSQTENLLRALNHQGYVARKGQLIQFSCSRVVCGYTGLNSGLDGASRIDVPVAPTVEGLPIIDRQRLEQIANEFQPQLLMYRLKNHTKVATSEFDVPGFLSPVREVARTLGACVPNERELQQDIRDFLNGSNEEAKADSSINLDAAVVEALLSFCHREDGLGRIFIGELTRLVNSLLEQRGELWKVQPRAVGHRLKLLGLTTTRLDQTGRGILLNDAIQARIHSLADDYLIQQDKVAQCQYCKFQADGEPNHDE
jgi:hypothetical protein